MERARNHLQGGIRPDVDPADLCSLGAVTLGRTLAQFDPILFPLTTSPVTRARATQTSMALSSNLPLELAI